MKIDTKEFISNSDITKEYKSCREKAKKLGKVVVLKNNIPDMILMDISEYEKTFEKLYNFFDEIEHIEIYNMLQERKNTSEKKTYNLNDLRKKLKIND